MSQDIKFNPKERDIIIQGGDFSIANDVSTGLQNGFIMISTTCVNYLYPAFGINYYKALNSPSSSQTQLMIRWSSMCSRDNAVKATYILDPSNSNSTINSIETIYL